MAIAKAVVIILIIGVNEMKTLNVILCDDDADSIERMRAHVIQLCRDFGAEANIICCSDGDMLLDKYQADTDILFLDVEMPLLDGIQAAEQIRAKDERVVIVFMSRFERYAIKGYYAGAWRYLLKPVDWDTFRKELEIPVNKILFGKTQTLSFKNDLGVYAIPLDKILYLEVNSKKNVDIHTDNDCFECYRTMENLQSQLPAETFFRCHKSFIVNLDYISSIENETITLLNGSKILLSRRRKQEFMLQYMDHAMKAL